MMGAGRQSAWRHRRRRPGRRARWPAASWLRSGWPQRERLWPGPRRAGRRAGADRRPGRLPARIVGTAIAGRLAGRRLAQSRLAVRALPAVRQRRPPHQRASDAAGAGCAGVCRDCCQLILVAARRSAVAAAGCGAIVSRPCALFRLLVAVGGLVLVHNLYAGASAQSRRLLRWPALALAAMWLFDLNYSPIAYLAERRPKCWRHCAGSRRWRWRRCFALGARPGQRGAAVRPVALGGVPVGLAAADRRPIWSAMVALAQWLAYAGGDLRRLIQIGFVAVATLACAAGAAVARLRGWLRVTLAKHLFQHRYDYRDEWLRFTRTIGQGGANARSLEERVVKAHGRHHRQPGRAAAGSAASTASWSWPRAGNGRRPTFPPKRCRPSSVRFFERERLHSSISTRCAPGGTAREGRSCPDWLLADPRAWALVPLLHYERLVGMVVLARPPHGRRLDWEDFDLLRVVGQPARQLSRRARRAGGAGRSRAVRRIQPPHRLRDARHQEPRQPAWPARPQCRAARRQSRVPRRHAGDAAQFGGQAQRAARAAVALWRAERSIRSMRSSADLLAVDVVARAFARPARGRAGRAASPARWRRRREALEQVLVHLVQNAIDASPAEPGVHPGCGRRRSTG